MQLVGKELTCCQSDKMLGKALHLTSFPVLLIRIHEHSCKIFYMY